MDKKDVTIVVWFTWPRSGSTWASKVLAEAIGLPWHDGHITGEENHFRRVHCLAREWRKWLPQIGQPCKTILGIRDPRDVVVSSYYKICHNRPAVTLDNLSLDAYMRGNLLKLTRPVRQVKGGAAEPSESWVEFYRNWRAQGVDVEVRHEDMLSHPVEEIERLAHAIDLPIIADVEELVAAYPLKMRAPYNRAFTERVSQPETIPVGASRWHEHLTSEEADLIWEHCKDIMKVYGYKKKG